MLGASQEMYGDGGKMSKAVFFFVMAAPFTMQGAIFTTVSLAPNTNYSLTQADTQGNNTNGYVPLLNLLQTNTTTTLGGIPFDFGNANGALWNGYFAATGSNVATLSLNNLAVSNATSVYLLANMYGNQTSGFSPFATVTINGTGGATSTFQLQTGRDIRDWYSNTFVNTFTSSTTTNVYDSPLTNGQETQFVSTRLDMVTIALPASFQGQTLTNITIADAGSTGPQRLLLSGVTVAANDITTPEPSTFSFFAIGIGLVFASASYSRRKKLNLHSAR